MLGGYELTMGSSRALVERPRCVVFDALKAVMLVLFLLEGLRTWVMIEGLVSNPPHLQNGAAGHSSTAWKGSPPRGEEPCCLSGFRDPSRSSGQAESVGAGTLLRIQAM